MTSNSNALKLNFFSDDAQQDIDRNICRFIAGQLELDRVLENVRGFLGNWSKSESFCNSVGILMSPNPFPHFQPSLMNDGVLRASQSLINQLSEERVSLAKYTELINKFTSNVNQPKSELTQKLFQLLQPIFIVLQFDSPSNPKVHRNACLVLLIVFENDNQSTLNPQIKSQLLAYLTKLITSSKQTDYETKLFSLILIEKFWFNQKVGFEIQKQLISALQKIVDFQASALFNPIRYQLEFFAQWYLDNEFHHADRDEKVMIKLFPDCLSARTDSTRFPTVRCAFQIQSGVYYYEATLLTDGHMQIGWCTQQSRFTPTDGVGNATDSISFDGFNVCIWQGRTKHPIKDVSRWKAGDVVGCLVDADKSEFAFYLNGKQLTQSPFKLEQPINQCYLGNFGIPNTSFGSFGSKPMFQPHNPYNSYNPSRMYSYQGPSTPKIYYAAASLATYQQINFNFGQSPFRFTPQVIGKSFSSFNSKSKSSIEYQLQEPAFRNDEFYFH